MGNAALTKTALKGETGQTGQTGQTGAALTYADLTQEQKDALKGAKGDTGNTGAKGDTGNTGAAGDVSLCWPVGSVFVSVVATDPSTLLGFGTWAALATGRVLVGYDAGDADFDTLKETGGAKTVASSNQAFTGTQSTTIVNHTHDTTVYVGTTDGTYGTFDSSSTTPGSAKTITTGNPKSGGAASYTPAGTNAAGAATSVVQPYLVVRFWERTA